MKRGCWTEDEALVEKARRLFVDEGKSAGVVGRIIGVSRNAIIGVMHRRGWRREGASAPTTQLRYSRSNLSAPRPVAAPRGPKPPKAPKAKRTPQSDFPIIRVVKGSAPDMDRYVGKSPKLLEALGAHDCRWPQGPVDAPAYLFCADPKAEDSSYCPIHTRLQGDGVKRPIPKPYGDGYQRRERAA